jgi:hypothetical protein
MAESVRSSGVKQVPLSQIRNDLSRFLPDARGEEKVITRNEGLSGSRPPD